MASAIFRDIWSGATRMVLATCVTSRHGERVTAYRWIMADGESGCIVTGFKAFTSAAVAVAAARRHALFSDVVE